MRTWLTWMERNPPRALTHGRKKQHRLNLIHPAVGRCQDNGLFLLSGSPNLPPRLPSSTLFLQLSYRFYELSNIFAVNYFSVKVSQSIWSPTTGNTLNNMTRSLLWLQSVSVTKGIRDQQKSSSPSPASPKKLKAFTNMMEELAKQQTYVFNVA